MSKTTPEYANRAAEESRNNSIPLIFGSISDALSSPVFPVFIPPRRLPRRLVVSHATFWTFCGVISMVYKSADHENIWSISFLQ